MRSTLILAISFFAVACNADNVTTVNPNSTTTVAPTPSPTPLTTTLAPTTPPVPVTTTVAPVTTPAPAVPALLKFNVTDGNLTCIEAEFGLQFKNLWNETVVVKDSEFDSKSSKCTSNDTEVLAFSFLFDKRNYSVALTFSKSGEERSLSFIDVKQGTESVKINQTAFKLSGDKFYSCEHSTEVLGNNVTAVFDHVKLSVFRTESSGNEVFVCVNDDTVNDMVPIAVGCALLALVVIVLIAYFIGRRRSRRLAYQSV